MKKLLVAFVTAILLISSCTGLIFAEKTEILWATCCGQADRTQLFDQLAKQYMAENPNVEITVIWPPGSYNDTLKTWIVAGSGADVMWIGQGLMDMADMMLPLNDLVSDRSVGTIHPKLLQKASWNGAQIGIPFGANANVLTYNKDMLSEYGIASPTAKWTWDDAYAMGKRIAKDLDGDGRIDQWLITPVIGVNFYQADDFYTADMRHTNLTNPVHIAASQFLLDTLTGRNGICPPGQTYQSQQFYLAKKVTFLQIGPFSLPTLRSESSFDWDIVPAPAFVYNGKRYDSSAVALESWSVNKESKNPKVAADFVRWLLQPAAMQQVADAGIVIPTLPRVQSAFLKQPTPPKNLNAFFNALENAKITMADHPAYSYVNRVLSTGGNELYNKVYRGETSAATAFPELDKQINAILAEWWAK